MKRFFNFLLIVFFVANVQSQQKAVYLQSNLSTDVRLTDLVNQLTLDEKIDMLAGYNDFYFHPVERLGIPAFVMADGPVGIASWGIHGRATSFPSGVMSAATWNRTLIAKLGDAFGQEWRARGIHYLLAPGVNMYRASKCGRNFEYYGEDPYLTSELVVPFIKGVQRRGVAATIKHYVGNEQEFNRYTVNSNINERTLNEIYLPPFKAAVQKADVMAVMAAYNPINGEWSTQNKTLLNDVLKEKWGFKGLVMSDWGCTYSTDTAVNAGLDMEMGSFKWFTPAKMKEALKNGSITHKRLDDMVRRIFYPAIKLGFFDRPQLDSTLSTFNPSTIRTAKEVAREGIVLLKNEKQVLPLSSSIKSIAVIGMNANPVYYKDRFLKPNNHFVIGGGGSSKVNPWYETTMLQGIMNNVSHSTTIQYNDGIDLNMATKTAKQSEVVVLFLGFNSGQELEGVDRPFDLPKGQSELASAILAANPNTIVVINAGGGVNMLPWVDKASTLVHCFYAGSEGANALAEILLGKVNPSGKLPMSIEREWKDSPAFGNYDENYLSGVDMKNITYNEGIYIGYRWYEKKGIKPLFPFGHGLSYTSFEYSNLEVNWKNPSTKDEVLITFNLKNNGSYDGAEIAQVYVSQLKPSVDRPKKELKGFEKVFLTTGETKKVSITLEADAFKYYDVKKRDWKIDKGVYTIYVAASSESIKLQKEIKK